MPGHPASPSTALKRLRADLRRAKRDLLTLADQASKRYMERGRAADLLHVQQAGRAAPVVARMLRTYEAEFFPQDSETRS